jgi:hypothetical protein
MSNEDGVLEPYLLDDGRAQRRSPRPRRDAGVPAQIHRDRPDHAGIVDRTPNFLNFSAGFATLTIDVHNCERSHPH